MTIGSQKSAAKRIAHYIAEFRRMLAREPAEIILFAEDYDAMGKRRDHAEYRRYRFVRGPSIAEYAVPVAEPQAEEHLPIYTGDGSWLYDWDKPVPRPREP